MKRRRFLETLAGLLASPFVAKPTEAYPDWRNYIGCYANISKAELVQAIRRSGVNLNKDPRLDFPRRADLEVE